MALRKRCCATVPPGLPTGQSNPLCCPTSPRCSHHWHYDFRVNRQRYRASTETADKHQARDIEARERARILEGRHGIRHDSDISFRAFAQRYLTTHSAVAKRPSTAKRDRDTIRVLERFFGNQRLCEITQFGIEQFRARQIAAGLKPSTVNRQYFVLTNLLRKAVEWRALVTSPAEKLRPLRVLASGRDRILLPDEQRSLLAAYEQGRRVHVRPIIELLLITGTRLGEVLALKWADLTDREVTLYKTKNGRPRSLPMTDELRAVFAAIPRRGEYVFPSFRRPGRPYQRILTGFKAALRDAGITTGDVCIHTLRHTALSRMVAAGLDLRTVMDISGHSRLEELTRYTHPNEQAKAAALSTFRAVADTNRSQSARILRHKATYHQ